MEASDCVLKQSSELIRSKYLGTRDYVGFVVEQAVGFTDWIWTRFELIISVTSLFLSVLQWQRLIGMG